MNKIGPIPSAESVKLSANIHQSFSVENIKDEEIKPSITIVDSDQQNQGPTRHSIRPISAPPFRSDIKKITKKSNETDDLERCSSVAIVETQFKLFVISNNFVTSNNDTNNQNHRTNTTLNEEKQDHQNKASKREEKFRLIISNEQNSFEWWELLVYLFGIIIIGFSSTLALTLIPAQDLVQYPEYWYEFLFHAFYAYVIYFTFICLYASALLNLNYLALKKNILFVTMIGSMTFFACMLLPYYIWCQILGYYFPIPFLGLGVSLLNSSVLMPLFKWMRFPKEWRQNKRFKEKFVYYLCFVVFSLVHPVSYQIIARQIMMVNVNNQPLQYPALALPIMRELFIWIGTKITEKCCNGDMRGATIAYQYGTSLGYTIFLCYVVGFIASETTSWVLMSIDFSINILTCLSVIWTRKRHPYKIQKQIDLLQDLAMAELIEFIAPVSFTLVIAVAYYSPNARIIGNIGNSYWGFSAIEDIGQTLKMTFLFFLVDFSSLLVSSAMLWFTCEISLCKAIHELQKEFGIFFCVTLVFNLVLVSKTIFNSHHI